MTICGEESFLNVVVIYGVAVFIFLLIYAGISEIFNKRKV
jgi:hypothetical protein